MNHHPDLIASLARARLADLRADAALSRATRPTRADRHGRLWRRRRARAAPDLQLVRGSPDVAEGDVRGNRVA